MTRYFYETAEDKRGRWFVYDRKRGMGTTYCPRGRFAVCMCFTRDEAEQIVKALNAVDA